MADSNMAFAEHYEPLPLRQSGMVFNSKEFNQIDKSKNALSFTYPSSSSPVLNITFHIIGKKAISLTGCPYSGLVVLKSVEPRELAHFLKEVSLRLESKDIKEIEIRQSPVFAWEHICPEADKAFIEAGFVQKHVEINHHIQLGQADYLASVHLMQRRKIKKCMQNQLEFKEEKNDTVGQIHHFIELCRKQQGLPINISLSQLRKTIAALPEHYRIFSIRNQQNEIVAATITVTISKHIIYNFLPAFDREYKTYSPLTFLTMQLHNRLSLEGFKYLDLGISSIEGKPQKNLITFKQRMGAIASKRIVYQSKL